MMQKHALLWAATVLHLCAQPLWAANSVTTYNPLPINVARSVNTIKPLSVSLDTTDSLTLITPASGRMVCVVGLVISESTPLTLTFLSGNDILTRLEMGAYQGVLQPVGSGASFCTQPGQALKVQSSAPISQMLLYVLEESRLQFGGRF